MRQKSTTLAELAGTRDLRLHNHPTPQLVHDPTPSPGDAQASSAARYAAAPTDRRQARRDPRHATAGALAAPPTPRTSSCDAQLLSGRIARLEQHDLGAPPLPAPVALGHMRDDPRGLQVIKPALHALAMRTHKPRPLTATARNRAPGHHRRQPDHELLHRRRKPPRPSCVTEPEQVALDRVHPRLNPIITRRDTTPPPARATQQRAHHQAARLVGQRGVRRSIPTTTGRPRAGKRCAFQRHRQRPKTPGARRTQRSRADARGAAGPASSSRTRASTGTRGPHPSKRGWRSVRRTATVGGQCICGCSSRSTEWLESRTEDRVASRSFSFCGVYAGGPRHDGLSGDRVSLATRRTHLGELKSSAPAVASPRGQARRMGPSAVPQQLALDEEHCSSNREQAAPHLLPMHPLGSALCGVPVRASSHLERGRAAAQTANSQFCATALTSGDGGN
jgi:hypothetical protein